MNGRLAAWLGVGSAVLAAGCAETSAPAPRETPANLAAYVLDAVPSDVAHPLSVDFDGKVQIVGYSLEPEGPVAPGGKVHLTLYWKCHSRIAPGWSLFTHLLDPRGRLAANRDDVGPLRTSTGDGQALGPGAWEPGKVYVDEQDLEIPANVEEVTIAVGVWRNFNTVIGTDGGKAVTEGRGLRLPILGGATDGQNRAVIAHVVTGWKAPAAPAGSAAPH